METSESPTGQSMSRCSGLRQCDRLNRRAAEAQSTEGAGVAAAGERVSMESRTGIEASPIDCSSAGRLLPSFRVVATYAFFFQAEDGIRDYKVTGVQTCALPI